MVSSATAGWLISAEIRTALNSFLSAKENSSGHSAYSRFNGRRLYLDYRITRATKLTIKRDRARSDERQQYNRRYVPLSREHPESRLDAECRIERRRQQQQRRQHQHQRLLSGATAVLSPRASVWNARRGGSERDRRRAELDPPVCVYPAL